MSRIIIITVPPPPTNGAVATRVQQERHEFDTKAQAIEFINNLPEVDELPAGDGSVES